MADIAMPDAYGRLVESTTLKIERLLPGPIERVWAYLTQSELRRGGWRPARCGLRPTHHLNSSGATTSFPTRRAAARKVFPKRTG